MYQLEWKSFSLFVALGHALGISLGLFISQPVWHINVYVGSFEYHITLVGISAWIVYFPSWLLKSLILALALKTIVNCLKAMDDDLHL